uniref:T-complex-associated testis-expressed protein 1 n=1 Tax=Palpitomonas bilix TaxID=652834 RepID=A0A7S3GGA2_9EUKA|mmetsp:Transcript_47842/g.124154  ORF Transcript_47842/g.124154 Transcript_47842/m.124154 type:complete len:411 (+) Transcript_47842:1362-2594(+)|eukprot:CAMPEP_0113879910 /NCGR_PEP_ID=MMETSP0780_2-20120614/7494_1 /TAXON_ID=652834 /ORGANISM="Palpitomonas bilix" /LENGTH=410 /DNA_ID=CAMNT_0000866531 /DNA_START=283 /DNA_END=1515 /DNA_ORIENTATION=+ /assembly_acc=CAM_ASM_000599
MALLEEERPTLPPRHFGAKGKHGFELIPTLRGLCVEALSKHFRERPTFKGIPEPFQQQMMEILPSDLPLNITGALINKESYWRRCALERWQINELTEHGSSWKQLYFEKNLKEYLEEFDPAVTSAADFEELLDTSKAFVYQLVLDQLPSHMELEMLFARLPKLISLQLTYSLRNVGMDYDRSQFGMRITDAASLAKEVKATTSLTSLSLPRNLLDDDKVRILATGLKDNGTITALDLSHNKIADRGTRALAKILSPATCVLSHLNLADNQVHAEGGKFLGRAMQVNVSLRSLDLRLNRLGERGGCLLFEGMKKNSSLRTLNLSSNSLEIESARSFASLVKQNKTLTELDLSCNFFVEDGCKVLLEGLRESGVLVKLDLRENKVDEEDKRAIKEILRENLKKAKHDEYALL